MECGWGISALQARPHGVPEELRSLLRPSSNRDFLADLAREALNPRHTGYLLILFEPLFVEVRALWATSYPPVDIIPAYARILQLAPYLSDVAETVLSRGAADIASALQYDASQASDAAADERLVDLLLGLFRLLVCDNETFGRSIQPLSLQSLLAHPKRPVRYLAIRCLCLYLHAADAAQEGMMTRYIGEKPVSGIWEGKMIDYRFLSLWEEKRYAEAKRKLVEARSAREAYLQSPQISRIITQRDLGPHTAEVHGVLLPRSNAPSTADGVQLIPTGTTVRNLTSVARSLNGDKPVMLTGLAGSGKTLIIRHLARELNKLESMVTLHLNEQSDAKLLIGMYTTGSTPGTFTWRPGVLTTAVREGRWVLIEDLDRAPNDVISTLLPLIESGELLIPSRGEVVRAARGFKIIATLRTTLNLRGEQIVPGAGMIGTRFWERISIETPREGELGEIVQRAFSNIPEALVPQIMSVYGSLQALSKEKIFTASRSGMIRPVTSRDLFKWCSRINPHNLDDMFLEAVDCLAGSLENGQVRELIVACIARELHVDPQKRDHLLLQRTIAYKTDDAAQVTIGRTTVKRSQRKRRADRRPFAANDHTRRLLERISVAVNHREPLLLVGETGTGKTTAIQHLATELGRRMEVFNLSQQSESGDLLGGFKPVNLRSIMVPMKDRFDDLFLSTFSQDKNRLFLNQLNEHMSKGRWKAVCKFWQKALRMVDDAVKASRPDPAPQTDENDQPKKKKRKVEKQPKLPASFSQSEWDAFANDLKLVESQIANKSSAFAFKFVEGNIVKAVRNGDWVLLDEINLAAPDTLEALADLLTGGSGGTPSILLTETGNVERIEAHPNFRVFAAMNPATDVGKKDLPMGIRSRFTELYVESPDRDFKSLQSVVETYLDQYLHKDRKISADVANLYLHIQALNAENRLVDGANQKPHFSLRTLTRTLVYSLDTAPLHSLRRALYEGFCMSFLTFLDKSSEDLVAEAVVKYLKPQLGSPLQKPAEKERDYVQIRRDDGRRNHDLKKKGISKSVDDANFEKWLDGAGKDPQWLRRGRFESSEEEHYIITNFVWRNLTNLIRAASTRRFPVLIQGPTSAGKTSMIEYLAKRSGNKFVRINNHEHTDLQEYLGTYVSGNDGKLQFQEGILVKALREGHWIVLDELNLAPTDVLEALNRLLDDNRELLIPETQEIVRPHEDFMLFATQNPAGLYGGRKTLSRAFRNRFLELHFDDIPVNELKYILERRTQLPRSWCEHIVSVYRELSILRQSSRLFESKSFATLRDLFRWAMRAPETSQQLAEQGYMLLAERVRKAEERLAVKQIIEKVIKQTKIDEDVLYSAERSPEMRLYQDNVSSDGVVWTRAMRRLYALVANALRHNEPVLLVGETGCGKTTVCQMLADAFAKQLFIVNAHQNTETGDLIGAQRPIRNRAFLEQELAKDLGELLVEAGTEFETPAPSLADLLVLYDKLVKEQPERVSSESRQNVHAQRVKLSSLFEWADGSLVTAMKTGQYFLLDEISLADDSVLERLNSVLESSRTILLAEKGPTDSNVNASDGFQFLATMNPGGDYGKKELSPALRNRFTEIYVPALSDLEDITQIVKAKLMPSAVDYAPTIVNFSQWFNEKFNTSAASSISIRDTLAWVHFINRCGVTDPVFGVVHGAAMVFIDTLGANPAALLAISATNIDSERAACLEKLSELVDADAKAIYFAPAAIGTSDSMLSVGDFAVPRIGKAVSDPSFSMAAPTTKSNAMRVLRALQLPKPILLEGNPGVGKTTLVTAISKAVGVPLTRINLSEQTDLMDLFGSDVPVEGAQAGTFAWKDAPFLKAMKNGEWVLLDEMNLASQSVLEGLNACLDHRGEVYISELDQTFHQNPGFRVFAAQNPHHQGGGRKGLPASFVNRFTVVYADVFRLEDLITICKQNFPNTTERDIETLTGFISELDSQVANRRFGALGGPWEFNLRDTLRWLQLLTSQDGLLPDGATSDFLDTVITQRFRSEHDRKCVIALFEKATKSTVQERSYFHNVGKNHIQVGLGLLRRETFLQPLPSRHEPRKSQLAVMESMMIAVQLKWPVILVGPPASGKSSLIKQLASSVGAELVTSSMNADIDAMDLVGGYEQVDPSRQVLSFLEELRQFSRSCAVEVQVQGATETASLFLRLARLASPVDLSQISFDTIHQVLAQIKTQDRRQVVIELTAEAKALAEKSIVVDQARFQWVDGLLVQALEQGKWLVLDNANLCSSSVLDRLNGLLEPKGRLIINEHSTADGEARIVRPHPDFRIFMTMDARHGELSRAMRNRAVELFLLPTSDEDAGGDDRLNAFASESAMYRFRHVDVLARTQYDHVSADSLVAASLDHLSVEDSTRLTSFCEQLFHELFNQPMDVRLEESLEANVDFFSLIPSEWLSRASELISGFATHLGLGQYFEHAQTIHPLNNQSLVLFSRAAHSGHVSNDAYMLGGLLDLCRDLKKMQTLLQQVAYQAGKVKIRDRTRLGRSLVPSKAASKSSKDPFVGVGPFLQSVSDTLAVWVLEVLQDGFVDELVLSSIKPIRQFWFDLSNLTNAMVVEDAVFQVCLAIGHQVFSQLLSIQEPRLAGLQEKLAKSLASLKLESQLSTGLSMELLWNRFKPHTPSTYDGLLKLLQLEALADRLDASVWLTDAPLADLARVRSTLAGAMQIARTQNVEVGELIGELEVAIDDVEKGVREGKEMVRPWFAEAFEGICQFSDVAQLVGESKDYSTTPTLTLLAQRPTRATPLAAQSFGEALLGRMSTYLGAYGDVGPVALRGGYHVKLLKDVVDLEGANLAQMDLLRSEIDVLGQSLVDRSGDLLQDQTSLLAGLHQRILNELVHAHSGLLDHEKMTANAIVLRDDLPDDHYFRTGLKLLQRSLEYAAPPEASSVNAGQAWISLAIAFLWLYVPDRPFDPALRPLVERNLFGTHRDGLTASLVALRHFEKAFTGRADNLRTQLIEQDIAAMGTEPSVPAIARPPQSELAQLSGEFGNLLRVLDGLVRAVDAGETGALRDATLEMNIQQIVKRLSEGYRGYDDITAPVITFLHCLRVGVILAAGSDGADSGVEVFDYVSAHTPFFGGNAGALVPAPHAVAFGKTNPVDLRWHALSALAVKLSVQPQKTPSINDRNLIHDIFRSFYEQWKEKLEADQEKAAEQSGLYRFKGSLDVEEEATEAELQSLFPDFDQQDDNAEKGPAAPLESPQELARRLAVCHADIFVNRQNPTERIKALIEQSTEFVSKIDSNGRDGLEASLPAVFLALDKQSEHLLQESPSPRYYNFYTDANVGEAKKLVTLVHRVQKRFRQIQEVWPEHATLADVLRESDELLAFRHVEPVAKFLTKGEKLHAFIYQWQQVASREYSAALLYDDVTNLLVSWRQLELTTWARLFDIEVEKAKDDAKAWFFVAYQTVIAATESLGSGAAMEDHAQELLGILEQFALSTTAGQYHERIRLLEQFREQLALREVDEPSVRPVRTSLDNFIRYFARFAQPVREVITKGRATLEKDMKSVLKVASWKDRNIDALRQSAKKSHKKLFRVVRKFRDILNKPVDAVLRQDLPEPAKSTLAVALIAAKPVDATVDAAGLLACEQYVPGWSTRPSRFRDLSTTVRLMHRMSQPAARKNGGGGGGGGASTNSGAVYIQDFLASLEGSIAELQKATPATLTADNKNEVKHLKSRKRKLFADTLKELREMGFRSHVGGDVLEKQDGLAKVLTRLPTLPPLSSSNLDTDNGVVARGAEEYLHKTFNLMQQVRDVAREHSGDLTNADVARCIGSFESMLHATLKQREVVAKVLEEEEALERAVEQVKALASASSSAADVMPGDVSERHGGLPWISPMLRVAAHVVNAQARLGKLSFTDVVEGLLSRAQLLEGLVKDIDGLPALPKGLSSAAHEQLASRVNGIVEQLKQDIARWREQHPALEATLKQLLPWLHLTNTDANGATITENARQDTTTTAVATFSIADLTTNLFSTLDAILGSIQDVEKTHAALPTFDTTPDEESPLSPPSSPSWLAAETAALAAACKALHAPRVTSALHGSVLNPLRNLPSSAAAGQPDDSNNNALHAACALLASLAPLVSQYRAAVAGARARFAACHAAQARLAYRLAKAFLVVGARGFCTPSEKDGEEGGKGDDDDKLEGGTGLGEGEGAEDISKDVGEDEDLTELAREQNDEEKDKEEKEDEEGAVDMGEEEMEGQLGEQRSEDEGGEEDSGNEESEDEMDEEAGEVDDLGPSAVDEKMWDDGGGEDEQDKDREGKDEFGSRDEDELAGAKDDEQKQEQQQQQKEEKEGEMGEEEDENDPEEGAQEEEKIGGPDEQEPVDPHMQEGETLDLPDDLNMEDDQKSQGEEEDLGDMEDDLGDAMDEDETAPPEDGEGDAEEEAPVDLDQKPEEVDEMADDEKEDQAADPEEREQQEQVDEGELKGADDNNAQDDKADNDDAAETGLGMDAHEDKNNDDKDQASGARREDGAEGEAPEEQQQDTKEQGARGKASQQDAVGRDEEMQEQSAESQPFKKLGDMLEKWYNQQRQIQNASEKQDEQQQQQQQDKDVDMADADFEHLQDDEAEADTQALGAAEEDQARALDREMAQDVNDKAELPENLPAEAEDDNREQLEDVPMEDVDPDQRDAPAQDQDQDQDTSGQPNAFIGEPGSHAREDSLQPPDLSDSDSDVDEVDRQLSSAAITDDDDSFPRSLDSARALWHHHEAATRALAQGLTEQLRLILAPTLATKMRGGHRTGKRLNMKAIIPYIASQYKRDKIWLRRSLPSKRAYQIALCLDDSKSMADPRVSALAFDALALVSKALATLEAGDVSVLRFGSDVVVAHPFDAPPFAGAGAESGVDVFRRFGFAQDRTDVRALVERVIEVFAEARARRQSAAAKELWQLAVVISDGVCDGHAEVARLVRKAQEERIMIVFVVVDGGAAGAGAAAAGAGASGGTDGAGGVAADDNKRNSVLDLLDVSFVDGKVVKRRYMDSFPFRWYVVVRDVRELPGVLATALRQWFAEVVDTAGG
ncbi:midasin [Diplodia corticola]|uniref:Midasin n=1 Tax=Diplodia corticola TaxID=236234 RepID=A0A1J9QPB6_9PEZI|nr:midasin [Diplodia corticola]OJD30296.1 midasin [Diplodia corticola]